MSGVDFKAWMKSTRHFEQVRACLIADGKLVAVGVVLASVTLAFDLLTPLGIASGDAYVALVLPCFWAKHATCTNMMAVFGTVLVVAGYFLSPEGGIQIFVLINRALAILVIWAVALLSTKRLTEIKGREASEERRSALEERLSELLELSADAIEQLRHAQKLESIGRLIGGVAHEFNNLLMVVFGNLEMIEGRLGKHDPLEEFTSRAMAGARRGAKLTQSLLAFSRKQHLETKAIDMNRLILGMQALFQRTLGASIEFEIDLEKDLWLLSADVGQTEAALLNFVVNARDAMRQGGTITIRTSNSIVNGDVPHAQDGLSPGDYVVLEVTDTGTGMTPEVRKRAFEPFYTTKEVGKGTGLGLSVVYGFAKQSGGHVEVDSEVGKGTTMRLYLPRAEEQGGEAPEEERQPMKLRKYGGTILILEDDADVRALAAVQLTALGYDVIEAEDGPAALKILEERSDIDLLFTDIVLPGGMSGPETLKKARERCPHLRALFVSGYPEKDIEDLIVYGGGVPILRKPYTKSALEESVAAAMIFE